MPARRDNRFWRNDDVGITLIDADMTADIYAPHSHQGPVIAITETGRADIICDGRSFTTGPDRLLLFNPGAVHAGRSGREGWRHRSFHVEPAGLAFLSRLLGTDSLPTFNATDRTDGQMVPMLRDLHHWMEQPAEPTAVEERCAMVFGTLFRRHGMQGRSPFPMDDVGLARATDYIRACHAEPLTLTDIGRQIGLSPFALIALFKRQLGMTPHAYLVQIRLHNAIARARAREAIASAAVAAGFYDQSAFHRHFVRTWGVTPRAYLRAVMA